MNFRSFFWQVYIALGLLVIGTVSLSYGIWQATKSPLYAFLGSFFLAMGAGLLIANRLNKPLQALRRFLRKMAMGEFGDQVGKLETEVQEIHELAHDMEKIRGNLLEKVLLIQRQKEERDALLESMSEGVLAIDQDAKILYVNQAVMRILGIDVDVQGRLIHEVVRIPEVLDVVHESLEEGKELDRDIDLAGGKSRFLQVRASPLTMDEKAFGVVFVLLDVTRVRELEGMRKNFVSNVSHELRTPLTSIQGFAETLMNPAVKDPEEIRKFIEIIQRHASRLSRIIEDILTLSRIERDQESSQIELKVDQLAPTVAAAAELCLVKAQNKSVHLSSSCPPDLLVAQDRYLLEQAIVNLIDNAIRYSNSGDSVEVSVVKEGQEAVIRVKDNGIGIAEKQIPRIFERFYRVDKARSRELGGTGLGLSIVKHIALAHRGKIQVKSELGKGSIFELYLPLATLPHATPAS